MPRREKKNDENGHASVTPTIVEASTMHGQIERIHRIPTREERRGRRSSSAEETSRRNSQDPNPVSPPSAMAWIYTGRLEGKEVGAWVRWLNQHLPLPAHLSHLKRIRKQEGTLCIFIRLQGNPDSKTYLEDSAGAEGDLEQDVLYQWLKETDKVAHLKEHVVRMPVPLYQAVTRWQFDEWKQLWPMSYHPSNQRRLDDLEITSEEELAYIGKHTASLMAFETSACLIVDPGKDTVLAAATSQPTHPLGHAAMQAIDLVAKGLVQLEHEKTPQNNARPSVLPRKRQGTSASEPADKGSLGYLCKDHDVFLTREPCIMCAMALCHARVRRVFFVNVGSDGCLKTLIDLQHEPALNHHFTAYHIVLATAPSHKTGDGAERHVL